jgi:hypothetical protein
MPQLLHVSRRSGGMLLIHCQKCTLLHANMGSALLKVEQVLQVLGQQSCLGAEVRVPTVRRGLKALLLHGVLQILYRKKGGRQCCYSGEVALAQVSESGMRHHLNGGVGLTGDDGPRPRLRGVNGYRHTGLAHVHAVGHGQPTTVDQGISLVAETDECVI